MKYWRFLGIHHYAAVAGLLAAVGCGGNAHVELSAADALAVAADRMDLAIDEYHADIEQYDDLREEEVVEAFVARVRRAPEDETAVEKHTAQFKAALGKIRADRDTERTRRDAAGENVRVLREVAGGLRRLAVEQLTLDDELRRYLTGWLEARRAAQSDTTQRENSDE